MKIVKNLLSVLFAAQMAFAQAAAVDASKSMVAATFKQIGVEVTAKFNSVSGSIDFDAANPASGKAQITIALASFDLGEAEYNKEVQKKEWFNSAQFPQASFVSSSIKTTGAGKLLVQGALTIKGKTLDVTVPVAFKQDGKTQAFEGVVPIKRLYFNIGEGEWKDTDTLADDVLVKFKVVTSN
jgi:polyisoprenoid-binding protein YceI